jgi:hypothetical protein
MRSERRQNQRNHNTDANRDSYDNKISLGKGLFG